MIGHIAYQDHKFSTPKFLSLVGLLLFSSASVSGQAQKSPVSLSPASLSFGNQTVGAGATLTVKLTNNQNTALVFSSILAGGDFAIAATATCSTTVSLAGGKSCNIDVRFTPTAM